MSSQYEPSRLKGLKMIARKMSLGLVLTGVFYATIACGDTYRCLNSKGQFEFTNRPCSEGSSTEKIKTFTPAIPSAPKAEYDPAFNTPRRLLYPPLFPTPAEETQLKFEEKLEEMQQQLQQAEIDRELEKEAQENAALEAAARARQEADERAQEATEKAEQSTEELRNEILRSSIRTKNNIYLSGLLLVIGGFVTYFIKKTKKEKPMDENQKYGIAVIVISFLLLIFALVISDGWVNQLDFLENLIRFLRIHLISIETECTSTVSPIVKQLLPNSTGPCVDYYYLIDTPTKYVVLAFMSTAAYGLTTYLNITPAFMPWKKPPVK